MKTPTIALTLSGLICGGLLWVTFSATRSRADAEMRLQAANVRQSALRVALLKTEKTIAEESKRKSPLPRPAVQPVPVTQPKPPPKRTPGMTDLARSNPKLWNDFIASQKSQLQQRYVPMFQALNLSTEQREKFKTIHAADITRNADIGAAAAEQALGFKDPAIVRLREQSTEQKQSELKALLGERGFAEYKDFERTVRVRGFVDGFALQLSSSEPLSPNQANQLARVLATSSTSYQSGKDAEPGDLDWTLVDQEATAFLTPNQFAAWKLGIAHNRYGGSRLDLQLKKAYDAATGNNDNGK